MFFQTGTEVHRLEHFSEPISSCVWAPDGRSFVLGAFDRERSLCTWNLRGEKLHTWSKKNRTEDLALSADGRWLVAMDDENHIHVYDFATKSLKYDMELPSRPTSVSITKDSKYLLVNKQDGEARVFDIATRTFVQKYKGHSGGEYLIRSDFGGANENFVISGSEGKFILDHLVRPPLLTGRGRWICVHLAQEQRTFGRKAGWSPATV